VTVKIPEMKVHARGKNREDDDLETVSHLKREGVVSRNIDGK
jgi:hypothetical protein